MQNRKGPFQHVGGILVAPALPVAMLVASVTGCSSSEGRQTPSPTSDAAAPSARPGSSEIDVPSRQGRDAGGVEADDAAEPSQPTLLDAMPPSPLDAQADAALKWTGAGSADSGAADATVNQVPADAALDGGTADATVNQVPADAALDGGVADATANVGTADASGCVTGDSCAEGGVCAATGACVEPLSCKSWSTGEGIHEGSIAINQDNQLEALAELEGIWCITEELRVEGVSWPDLSPLSHILGVGLSIVLERNPELTSMAGLENLHTTGSLRVFANSELSSFDGLRSLTEASSLELAGNRSLTDLQGLPPINWEGIWFSGNGALEDLSELSSIQGEVQHLTLQGEPAIASLAPLSGVTSVAGNLAFGSLDSLSSFDGVQNIESVGGTLWMRWNANLTTLEGFARLKQVSSAHIADNPLLPQCDVDAFVSETGATCDECSDNAPCAP